MKAFLTFLILTFTLTSFSQEKDNSDYKRIFRKVKKEKTEVTVYSIYPNSYGDSFSDYVYHKLNAIEGEVHEIMLDGVVLLDKTSLRKMKKGELMETKNKLTYIRFEHITKIEFIIKESPAIELP